MLCKLRGLVCKHTLTRTDIFLGDLTSAKQRQLSCAAPAVSLISHLAAVPKDFQSYADALQSAQGVPVRLACQAS